MNMCEQCDLPMSVCNARCGWQAAMNAIKCGRIEMAIEHGNEAEEFWNKYYNEERNADYKS